MSLYIALQALSSKKLKKPASIMALHISPRQRPPHAFVLEIPAASRVVKKIRRQSYVTHHPCATSLGTLQLGDNLTFRT
jgi:hypothetical protein